MKLDLTNEEFNILVDKRIVVSDDGSNFYLNVLKGEDEETITLKIEVSDEIAKAYKDSIDLPIDYEEFYKEYASIFPNDVLRVMNLGKDGRNLRSGNKKTILSRLKARIQEDKFTKEEILMAAKYEVASRIATSSPTENKLMFMQAMEAWLHNVENIREMLRRAQESDIPNISEDGSHSRPRIKLL